MEKTENYSINNIAPVVPSPTWTGWKYLAPAKTKPKDNNNQKIETIGLLAAGGGGGCLATLYFGPVCHDFNLKKQLYFKVGLGWL